MTRKGLVAALTASALLACISGYFVADIYDYAPGYLTTQAPEYGQPIAEREKVQSDTILPAQMRTDLPPLKKR